MTHSSNSQIGRRTIAAFAIAALGIAAALTLGASSAQAQSITQGPNSVPLYGLGKPAVATIGQTFAAPTSGTLDSFSFWLSNEADELASNTTDADQLQFQAYVIQWDVANKRTIGDVLFSSAVQTGPTKLSQEYQFANVGVTVFANTQYVAFLSASGLFGSMNTDPMAAFLLSDDASAGGSLVFLDSQDDVSLFTNSAWQDGTDASAPQAQFRATFSSTTVPEPSSIVLVGVALIGLATYTRTRRRA